MFVIFLWNVGEQIYRALENGVSQYPKLEGRFPQVSGISFAFDPKKPPGSRIDPKFIKIGDEYLDMNQVCKKKFLDLIFLGKIFYAVVSFLCFTLFLLWHHSVPLKLLNVTIFTTHTQ